MLYYLVQALDAPPDPIITIKSDALYLNLLFVIYGHMVGQTYSVPLLRSIPQNAGRCWRIIGSSSRYSV